MLKPTSDLSDCSFALKRAEVKAPIQLWGTSGQYAHAVFGLASQEEALEIVEKDFNALSTSWKQIPNFELIMESPVVSNSQRTPLLTEALEKAGAHKITKSFFKVVTDSGRTALIESIMNDYKKLMSAHRREVHAVINSAEPLSPADLQKWTETVKKEYAPAGSQVTVSTKVDTTLLKGVAFQLGNEYYDFSAKPINDLIRKEWSAAIDGFFDDKIREAELYEKSLDN